MAIDYVLKIRIAGDLPSANSLSMQVKTSSSYQN